jgi:hypothetical protein
MFEIPQEIIDTINYEVAHYELDCADNYRAYRHKDNLGFEDYRDTRNEGCCGFYDSDYVDDNGDTWTIGCNYGH